MDLRLRKTNGRDAIKAVQKFAAEVLLKEESKKQPLDADEQRNSSIKSNSSFISSSSSSGYMIKPHQTTQQQDSETSVIKPPVIKIQREGSLSSDEKAIFKDAEDPEICSSNVSQRVPLDAKKSENSKKVEDSKAN